MFFKKWIYKKFICNHSNTNKIYELDQIKLFEKGFCIQHYTCEKCGSEYPGLKYLYL